jgi:predicted double-glycine peptidase
LPYRIDNSFSNRDASYPATAYRLAGFSLWLGSLLVMGWGLMGGCAGVKPDAKPIDPNPSVAGGKEVHAAFGTWIDKLSKKRQQAPPEEKDIQAGNQHPGQSAAGRPEEKKNESSAAGDKPHRRSEAPENRGSLMTIRLPNGMYITKKVVSLREARYDNVIPQKYDLSCGAAALATILNYFFEDRVDEVDIIKYMLEHGNTQEIQQKGFSLLDLKTYAVERGYLADGYRVDFNKLKKLKIPVIILFNSGSYSHFVVLKGIARDNAYIADPAYGNRSMPLETFEENWNGVIFVVATKVLQKRTPLQMETTLPAPVLAAMRLKDLFSTGFAGFISGEF